MHWNKVVVGESLDSLFSDNSLSSDLGEYLLFIYKRQWLYVDMLFLAHDVITGNNITGSGHRLYLDTGLFRANDVTVLGYIYRGNR